MSKALKIVLIVVACLVVLTALALVVVPALLPLERMVAERVTQSIGRPATVQRASLSLLGGLNLSIQGLVIQEDPRFGKRPLVKMGRLHMEASLISLLLGRLVVHSLNIDGLEVSLVRNKAGQLNLATLGPRPPGPQREAEKRAEPSQPGRRLLLTSAVLKGARVFLHNQATGQKASLPIEECRFKASLAGGRLGLEVNLRAPGVTVKATSLPSAQPNQAGRMNLALDLDRIGQLLAVVLPGLRASGRVKAEITITGPSEAKRFQGWLTCQNLLISHPQMKKGRFSLGDGRLDLDLKADLKAGLLRADQARFVSRAAGSEMELKGLFGLKTEKWGRTNGRYRQRVDLARFHAAFAPLLPPMQRLSGVAVKEVAIKGVSGGLSFKGRSSINKLVVQSAYMPEPYRETLALLLYDFTLGPQARSLNIAMLQLACKLAKFTLKGSVTDLGSRPQIKAALVGDHLDLDALAPLMADQRVKALAGKVKRGTRAAGRATGAGPKPTKKGKDDPDRRLQQALNSIGAHISLRLARMVYRSVVVRDIKGTLTIKDGVLSLPDLTAQPLSGRVDLALKLDARPRPAKGTLKAKARGIAIDTRAFRDLRQTVPILALPISGLQGVFAVDSNLSFRGLGGQQIKRSLNGEASLASSDVVTVGFDFLQRIPGAALLWDRYLADKLPRKFASLDGRFTFDKGNAKYLIKMLAQSGKLSGELSGNTVLTSGLVNAVIKFAGERLGRRFKRFLAPDGTFPLGLGGSFVRPIPRLRVTPGLRGLPFLRGRQGQEQKGPQEPGRQGEPKDEKPDARKLLKGILGR